MPRPFRRGPRPRFLPAAARISAAAVVLAALAMTAASARAALTRATLTEPAAAAAAAAAAGGEVLALRWTLTGFLGALAGLFVPDHGEALLTFVPAADDRQRIELLITAPKREGEYFLYGAEVEGTTGATRALWSSYHFKDESREKERTVDRDDVIDYASAIHHLRQHPPREVTRLWIWSGGKTYPVDIVPLKPGRRRISGVDIPVRGYSVKGVKVEGQPTFKQSLFLYFARDDRGTPVEIVGRRGWMGVRMQLVDGARLEQASAALP